MLVTDALPLRFAIRVAERAGDLVYFFDRRRRGIARRNILRAGLADDEAGASTIARGSYRHFAALVMESLKSSAVLDADEPSRYVTLDIHPNVREVLEDPERGLLMTSGHFGNWEIGAQLLSDFKPVVGITREMSNPYVERLVQKRKPRKRFRLTPKRADDSGRFLSVLNDAEVLALLIDQYAGDRGARVDFFGHPASTHTSPALLHLVTGVALCFCSCRRTGLMTFELTTSDLIRHERTGDKQRDIRAILETLNGHLEEAIRRAPDQYVWAHRRWRD